MSFPPKQSLHALPFPTVYEKYADEAETAEISQKLSESLEETATTWLF